MECLTNDDWKFSEMLATLTVSQQTNNNSLVYCNGCLNDIKIRYNNNTIIHFIETRLLKYNWHSNKYTDGLVNRLTSNLVILNQAHRVAWLIGQCYMN